LAALFILLTIVPLSYLPLLEFDSALEIWLSRDSAEFKDYQDFLKVYGSDEFIVIASETDDPLSSESLKHQEDLSESIRAINGIDEVIDLPLLLKITGADPEKRRDEILNNPFLKSLIIGRDSKTVGALVRLKPFLGGPGRIRLANEIREVVNGMTVDGRTPHPAGILMLNNELTRSTQDAMTSLLPISILSAIIILILSLKNIKGVLAVLSANIVTVIWAFGLMGIFDKSLNILTVYLPALLLLLALSCGIHLVAHYHVVHRKNRKAALRATLDAIFKPAALASITTAAGFGSLMISDMPPVADLGFFAMIGILIACLSNLIIVPAVLSLPWGNGFSEKQIPPSHWSKPSGEALCRRPYIVIFFALSFLVLCITGASQLKTESNSLEFLPDDSPVVKSYDFVSRNLTGFYSVEMDISCKEEDESAYREAITRFEASASSHKLISRIDHALKMDQVLCLMSILKNGNGPGNVQEGEALLADMRKRFFRKEGGECSYRVSIMVCGFDSSQFSSILDHLTKSAESAFPSQDAWRFTGMIPLHKAAEQALIDTQVKTFPLALTAVMLMICIVFRSIRALFASLLPNLLPIFCTLALMALIDIPISAATVVIAGISIGIAVDDTIYFLSSYKFFMGKGLSPVKAAGASLDKIGRAAVFTTIVAIVGFGILLTSDLKPIAYTGFLAGFTMIVALAADFWVLPACANMFGLWKSKSGSDDLKNQ